MRPALVTATVWLAFAGCDFSPSADGSLERLPVVLEAIAPIVDVPDSVLPSRHEPGRLVVFFLIQTTGDTGHVRLRMADPIQEAEFGIRMSSEGFQATEGFTKYIFGISFRRVPICKSAPHEESIIVGADEEFVSPIYGHAWIALDPPCRHSELRFTNPVFAYDASQSYEFLFEPGW